MRTALLADIHANLSALTAVLADIRESQVEAFACLGDTVGYGAEPRQCVEMVRALDCPCVMGNHDYYTIIDSPKIDEMLAAPDVEDEPVWSGIKHAREQLEEEELAWLRNLESMIEIEGAIIAHASLHDGDAWPYLRSSRDAQATLGILNGKVGFSGHTHRECVFVPDGSPPPEQLADHLLRLPVGSAAITVGSVGQPRDGDPRARWALWDSAQRTVEFRQVGYDVEAAAQAILAAGLSPMNAIRLFAEG